MSSGKIGSAFAALALVVAGPAAALGFGEFRAQVLLGQTLNVALPVTLGEGETLSAECASAEVTSGDQRLQPGTVRVRVTQGRDNSEAVIRIASTVAIDEPVVNVVVSAGCPTRITRSLVLLADPPLVSTVTASPTTEVAAAPVATTTPQTSTSAPARASRPAAPRRAAARSAIPRAVVPAPDVPAASAATAANPRPAAPASKPATAQTKGEARSRLQLDSAQISVSQAAVLAAEAQASAARATAAAAEAAASASQQRMKQMEAEVQRLRVQSQAQTDALVQLRQQMAQEQTQRRQEAWLLPLLLGLGSLLVLLAIGLAWRSRRAAPVPQQDVWWDKAGTASVLAEDDSRYRNSTLMPSAHAPLRVPSAPAPLMAEPDESVTGPDSRMSPLTVPVAMAATTPSLSQQMRGDDNSRAISVDEQIDLEQQADFFIALGHDESAIDLLMAHLRSTGGGTPLPFLKLLEIHRRRGDREAYERTRVRFNQRFNSIAPDWDSDPRAGRLLDAYPLIVGRIQHAWPKPLDVMAELESLLFRRGAGSEMFDLPAYQEVLFLYQLARDLHQAEQPDSAASDVDVLLPIGGAAPVVPEGTITLRPEFNSGEALSLDLDLTTRIGSIDGSSAPPSEFDLDIEGGDPKKDDPLDKDVWALDPGDRRRE